MTYLRADLAADVGETLTDLLSYVRVMPIDARNGLALPLNDAMRHIGIAIDAEIAESEARRAKAWATYFTFTHLLPVLVMALKTNPEDSRAAKFRDMDTLKTIYHDLARESDGAWFSGSIVLTDCAWES